MGEISSIFDRDICPPHDSGGYYHFMFLFFPENRLWCFKGDNLHEISKPVMEEKIRKV